MSTTISFVRANPVVLGILGFTLFAALLLGVIALMMSRAGVSPRPIAFIAGFLAIIAVPQFAFHIAQAFGVIPKRNLTWTFGKDRVTRWVEREDALAAADGRFVDPDAVFGEGYDRTLVNDLRRVGFPFETAEVAQMAVVPPQGSVVVARYKDATAAAAWTRQYMDMAFGVTPPPGPDGTYTFQRQPQGDVVKVVLAGRTMLVLTGPDEATLRDRLERSRIVAREGAATSASGDYWLYRRAVLAAVVVLLLLGATLFWFRGSAWAATVPARAGAVPVAEPAMRERLLAVNALDVPFTVREIDDGRMEITWRFADAKWVDLARAHGLRRTHRILLELDDATKTVYPTEQQSRVDWSAGADGASVNWSTSQGITFFQYEQQRVFGLQIDPATGRFVPKLSYAYTFDLQEMKAPLISAVTESGWRWRPTAWRGPSWLRWLTH